jgi:hypothetical protein
MTPVGCLVILAALKKKIVMAGIVKIIKGRKNVELFECPHGCPLR